MNAFQDAYRPLLTLSGGGGGYPSKWGLCLGVLCYGDPLDRDPPRKKHGTRDRDPLGRNMGPETETPRWNMGLGRETGRGPFLLWTE